MGRVMKRYKLTAEQAAGIVGNLGHESAGFTAFEEVGGGGRGWAQWTGPRRDAFFKWAEANNLDPQSAEANEGFLYHELDGAEAKSIEALRRTNNIEDATRVFESSFERAGVKNYESRDSYASVALSAYNSNFSEDEFGDLDPVDRAEIGAQIARAKAERMKVGSVYEAALAFKDNSKGWVPTNSDDKKRVGAVFDAAGGGSDALMAGDEKSFGIVKDIVTRTGMIPPDAAGAWQGMVRSDKPPTVVRAMQQLDELSRLNPNAFANDIPDDLQKKVYRYQEMLSFRSPEEIVAEFKKADDPTLVETRKKLHTEGVKLATDTYPLDINKFDEGIFYSQPYPPQDPFMSAALNQEYTKLFAEEFSISGDGEAASRIAHNLLKNAWGATDITGTRQLMKYRPEKYYTIEGLDDDWMGVQLTEMLEKEGFADREFVLRPNALTHVAIQNGTAPGYAVVVQDDDGGYVPIMGSDAKPKMFFLDPERAAKEHASELERTRAENEIGLRRRNELYRNRGVDAGEDIVTKRLGF